MAKMCHKEFIRDCSEFHVKISFDLQSATLNEPLVNYLRGLCHLGSG